MAGFGSSSLATDYRVSSSSEATLGSFQVWVIELEATDDEVTYPFKTIWVTREESLLLKSEDYSLTRRLLRTSYFPRYARAGDSYIADRMIFVDALVEGRTTSITLSGISTSEIPDSVFTKAYVISYATESGLSFDLNELFADIDIDDTVFIRAGKQTINWGVGIFFSPANLVNLDSIDPENPDAELSGPVSVKAQLPIGTDNVTAYLILGDIEAGIAANVAARYEFLVQGFEVTTGGILESDGGWALMATGNGSVENVTLFAEAVLEGNSDKVFVIRDAGSPTGLGTATSDSLFFSATLGGRYTFTTDDDLITVSTVAQYFFNGLGYDDPSILSDNPALIGALIASGDLTFDDLRDRGQHYGAVNLSAPDLAASDVTPSIFWLGSLSDGSGLVRAGMNYSGIDFLTPNLSYSYSYGSEGSELAPDGPTHRITLSFTLGGSF